LVAIEVGVDGVGDAAGETFGVNLGEIFLEIEEEAADGDDTDEKEGGEKFENAEEAVAGKPKSKDAVGAELGEETQERVFGERGEVFGFFAGSLVGFDAAFVSKVAINVHGVFGSGGLFGRFARLVIRSFFGCHIAILYTA